MDRREEQISAEEKSRLLEAIDSLPEVQANLVVLHYLQNVPLKDVGLTLKLSHAEIALHHHGALMALRRWNESRDGV